MANNFKIEVPIKITGDKGGKKVGESIAEQIKKSLGSIGIGKGGTGGATSMGGAGGAIGLKTLGILGAILGVAESIGFILKPILNLFKVILMLLFMPLIPILKPAMQALAAFVKWFAPLMRKAVLLTEKIHKGIVDFITSLVLGVTGIFKGIFNVLGAGWDMIKNAGAWIWDNILMPGFNFLKDAGIWIWDMLVQGFSTVLNFGMWIWDKFVLGLQTISDLGKKLWEFIKSLFVGTISVGIAVFDWFKGLFKGTISVATTVWSWFKGLFSGGGSSNSRSVNDAIITPQGVVHTNPQDYIIATKNPAELGGGKITININNPSVRNDMDVRKIANQVSQVLQRQMSGRISQ